MFYRHRFRHFSLSILAMSSAIALNMAPALNSTKAFSAVAQQPNCPGDNHFVPAATTTRTVEFPQFGATVTIPSNFRTLLYSDGTVAILHPADFNLIQCLTLGLPVLGTDAMQPETFQLRSNPEGLSAQDYAMGFTIAGFTMSETVYTQTVEGTPMSIREATETPNEDGRGMDLSIFYAWYQPVGIDDIVEITANTRDELLDLLSRIQL